MEGGAVSRSAAPRANVKAASPTSPGSRANPLLGGAKAKAKAKPKVKAKAKGAAPSQDSGPPVSAGRGRGVGRGRGQSSTPQGAGGLRRPSADPGNQAAAQSSLNNERRTNLAVSLQDADERLKTQLELASDSQLMPVDVTLTGHVGSPESVERPLMPVQLRQEQQSTQLQQLETQQPELQEFQPHLLQLQQHEEQQQRQQQPLQASSSSPVSARSNDSQNTALESPMSEPSAFAPMEKAKPAPWTSSMDGRSSSGPRPGPGLERELALETMRHSLSSAPSASSVSTALATAGATAPIAKTATGPYPASPAAQPQALAIAATAPTHVLPGEWAKGHNVDLTPHFNLCATASRYMGNVDLSVLPPMKHFDLLGNMDLSRHRVLR